MKPLIGITTASYTDNGILYNRSYNAVPRAVAQAGGLPVLIPTGIGEDALREIYERLDAVLLPGGPDVDPSVYGQEKHSTTRIDAPRDAIELPLARWAAADDLPMFGICRGHQVINVALGGSLIQDLPSQRELVHDIPDGQPRSTILHAVTVEPNSKLASILGEAEVPVNSLHHQAVDQIAPGMVITAYSPDGIIEATEMPDKRFAVSVQWHPEDLTHEPTMRRLFEAFVEAARERQAQLG